MERICRRDEGLFKAAMSRVEESLRYRAASPEARFCDAIVEATYAAHPYAPRELSLKDVARVNLDRSIALQRQRFSSAKGLTFILVGDFDLAAIKPLITRYLATLPTPDLPLAYRDVGLRFAKGVVKQEVVAGKEAKSIVSLTFAGAANWSPEEAMRMGALTEVMTLRVTAVLREKLGLIYGSQITGSVDHIPDQHYAIKIMLPTGPEKVDQTISALFAEIERIKTEGPTEAELDKVKANWNLGYPQWQQDNSYWLGNLQATVINRTDPARLDLKAILGEIKALTVADVQKAAQRYFKQDQYIQVVLNPEKQVTPAGANK